MPSGWMASGSVGVLLANNAKLARGAKQSGRTERSASDDGKGRCAGGTSVKSREMSRDRSEKWLCKSIAGF